MITKEKILQELDDLDDEDLEIFYELAQQFLQSRRTKTSGAGLLAGLSQIQIEGPEDFAENINLYLFPKQGFTH